MRAIRGVLLAAIFFSAASCERPRSLVAPSPTIPLAGQASALQVSPTFTTTIVGTMSPAAPTPTLDIAVILVEIGNPRLLASYSSPNGNWRAEVLSYDCAVVLQDQPDGNALEQLAMYSVGDGSERLLDSQLINCGGLGAFGFEGLFWSQDSRFFYYTDARQGVPDGCGYWERPLLRVHIDEWTTEHVGEGAISPDGTKIAAWNDGQLVLWELAGERIAATQPPVQDAIPGPIAWSPDSQGLVYLLSEAYCPLGETNLVRMDLADLTPLVLFSSQTPSFASVRWEAPQLVVLSDDLGHSWTYNLVTHDLHSQSPGTRARLTTRQTV